MIKLKSGKYWDIYFNEKKKLYILKSEFSDDIYESVYHTSIIEHFNTMENIYRIEHKNNNYL